MTAMSPNRLTQELLAMSCGQSTVNVGQLCIAAHTEIVRLRQVAKEKAVRTLVPWYGGNRTNAELVGELLEGCDLVGVLFAGGMPELLTITARQVLVCDTHSELITLAQTIRDEGKFGRFLRRVTGTMFHEGELADAQTILRRLRDGHDEREDDVAWAFFVNSWMIRNGDAGKNNELDCKLAMRWTTSGGDSAVRWRSAIVGTYEFHDAFQRCSFLARDFEEVLAALHDKPEVGIYLDPPWFGKEGSYYLHGFTREQHERLAELLSAFQHARIVLRINDHAETWRLYPRDQWEVRQATGRNSGGTRDELYLCRRVPSEKPNLLAEAV